jgi:hypothetical protein
MSQENIEIVRTHFDAIVREVDRYWDDPRPFVEAVETGKLRPDGQQILDRLHPAVRWTNVIGEVREGKLACARGVDELLKAAQSYSVRVEEITDLDDDRVLVVIESTMRGESSGASGAVRLFTVETIRAGLIVQTDEYLSRTDALKAVGLEE